MESWYCKNLLHRTQSALEWLKECFFLPYFLYFSSFSFSCAQAKIIQGTANQRLTGLLLSYLRKKSKNSPTKNMSFCESEDGWICHSIEV